MFSYIKNNVRFTFSLQLAFAVALLLLVTGCSADHYKAKADTAVSGILTNKTSLVNDVDSAALDIEQNNIWNRSPLKSIAKQKSQSFLGKNHEAGTDVLTLMKALDVGLKFNRNYLSEKESVFLSALNLTQARHSFEPIFGGIGDLQLGSDSRNAQLTNLVATNTFARNQAGSFDRLYRTGARLSADFSRDFLSFLSGDRDINNSQLAVTLVQPLLRGGGRTATTEALTQADRNVLYALREFSDFRRDFVVDLVSDYYSVLLAKDNVQNAYNAYLGFQENMERETAFEVEGRRSKTELGQLQQALLQSEVRWLNAIRTYESRLDQFKLFLGVPVDDAFILDDQELTRLSIRKPNITRDQAVEIALVTRPDLETSRNRIEDAEREIEVAKNDLKPGLDIRVDYSSTNDPGGSAPSLNLDRRNISTRLDVDLPLDRLAERNQYRSALISKQAQIRQHEANVDQVRVQVNDNWRQLALAERSYEIAVKGVELAIKRVEEQNLLFELGKGLARDLVDAQNDLVDAKDDRTSALIDHTIARLSLWRDLGILYINEDSGWKKTLEQEGVVQ